MICLTILWLIFIFRPSAHGMDEYEQEQQRRQREEEEIRREKEENRKT